MAKQKSKAAPAKAATGAAGGAIAGTNTTAADSSENPVVESPGAAQAAPATTDQKANDAPTANEGSNPPAGGEPVAIGGETAAHEPDGFTITHLQVGAKKDGFRRAGRAWTAREVTVSIDDFSMEQIEALIAEPMLVVIPVAGAE